MDELLEIALLGNADDEEIEMIILDNVLINRDNVGRQGVPFNLDNFSDEEVITHFRFERADLLGLVALLGIPEQVITETSNRVNGRFYIYYI